MPSLLTGALAPDVVLVHTSLPSNGTVSLGTEVNVLPAAIEAARARGGLIVAQLNPARPYTYGDGVPAKDEIDYAIEADTPLPSPAPRPAAPVAQATADRVAALVPEGATLQLGIGAIPRRGAWGAHGEARSRGLAVWSEMFSDGVLAMERRGRSIPAPPSPPRSRSAARSFMTGSAETPGSGCCGRRRPTIPV